MNVLGGLRTLSVFAALSAGGVLSNGVVSAETVMIGSQLSEPFANIIVADKEGFFRKQGLDVKLLVFASAVELTTAVLSGDVDYAFSGAAPVFPVYAKGEKVKIFVSTVNAPAYFVMAARGIGSITEAVNKGAVTGVAGLGGLDYHVVRWMVANQGLDPNKLKYVSAGPPGTRARALLAGRVDLIATLPPASYVLEDRGATRLLDMGTMVKALPLEVGWASTKKLTDQPQVTRAVIKALIDASAWMLESPDPALRHVAATLKTPADQVPYLKRALEYYGKYWIRQGDLIDEPGLRLFLNFFVENKVIDPANAESTLKGIYTNQYLK